MKFIDVYFMQYQLKEGIKWYRPRSFQAHFSKGLKALKFIPYFNCNSIKHTLINVMSSALTSSGLRWFCALCKSVTQERSIKSVKESEMTAKMVLPVSPQRKIASISSLREPATGEKIKFCKLPFCFSFPFELQQ